MPKYLNKEDVFLNCRKDGKFIAIANVDVEKIKSTLLIAEADASTGKNTKKAIPKNSIEWNSVYKLYYDALHELAEAFLRFDNIKSDNHQCLFAFLCEKHPELEFNWEFFEKVRTKRNGINYYGTPIKYDDWKEVELQFEIYIHKLKEEIQRKLREAE
jgi:hypothetical protein